MDLRREFSNVSPAAKTQVRRLLKRADKTDEVRSDAAFEDARGPNVRQLRHTHRRLSPPEVEALVADYEAGQPVGELARVYGVHRTTVSAQVAQAGKRRQTLTDVQVDEAVRLYGQGWSLRAVGRHFGISDKTVRRAMDGRAVPVRPRGQASTGVLAS